MRTTPSPETDQNPRPQDAPAVWSEEQVREKRSGGVLGAPTVLEERDEALTVQGGLTAFSTEPQLAWVRSVITSEAGRDRETRHPLARLAAPRPPFSREDSRAQRDAQLLVR